MLAAAMFVAASADEAATGPRGATVRDFVTGVYRAYDDADHDPLGAQAGAIFSPSLLALIRRDKAPAGVVGTLDFDPVCACQDADGLKLLAVRTGPVARGRAHATSIFRISATTRKVELTLVKTSAGWRIDDVRSGSGSLRRLLARPDRR